VSFLEYLAATFSGAMAAIVVASVVAHLFEKKEPCIACMVRRIKIDPDPGRSGDYYKGWSNACTRVLDHLQCREEYLRMRASEER
jgi:hypothetical protein